MPVYEPKLTVDRYIYQIKNCMRLYITSRHMLIYRKMWLVDCSWLHNALFLETCLLFFIIVVAFAYTSVS